MLKELFFKRWVGVANGLLFLYSIATTLRDAFSSETQQKYQLNLLLHHWSWQTWVAVFAVGNFFVVLKGAKLAIGKREKARDELAAKLEEIEKAKPRITLKEPGAFYIQDVSQQYGAERFNSVSFVNVRFINSPAGPYPSAKATDVRATLDYYSGADNKHLLSIDGRWSETDQPSAINPLASKSHLLATNFGIGEAHSLDIAYRDPRNYQLYAWNNDNYQYPYFRYDHHWLEGNQAIRVEIRLLGVWVDERFSVRFKIGLAGLEFIR
jgi:hypothetical protein